MPNKLIFFGDDNARNERVRYNYHNTIAGQILDEACAAQPGDKPIYSGWELEHAQNHALRYLLSGKEDSGRIAIKLALTDVRKGMAAINVQGSHGLEVRDVLPRVALVLNWCSPLFTEQERRDTVRQLEEWVRWIWPETNPGRAADFAVDDPGDNFYHGYMLGTWLTGLALQGWSDRAHAIVTLMENRWERQALPFLKRFHAGGYPLEGTTYGVETLNRIWQYRDASAMDLGGMAFGDMWPDSTLPFLLHFTAPDRTHHAPFGDAGGDHRDKLTRYAVAAALIASNHLPNEQAGELLHWVNQVTQRIDPWPWLAWHDVLWVRTDIPTLDYKTRRTKSYYAPGGGFVSSRTSWQKDADQVVLVAGPGRQNHADLAQGGFAVWAGKEQAWATGPHRIWADTTLLRETSWHNVVTAPPYNQPEFDARLRQHQDRQKITGVQDTEQYLYVDMDLTDAYRYWQWRDDHDMAKNAVPAFSNYRRRLCWVKSERALVIFDQILGGHPNQQLMANFWFGVMAPVIMAPGVYLYRWSNGLAVLSACLLPADRTRVRADSSVVHVEMVLDQERQERLSLQVIRWGNLTEQESLPELIRTRDAIGARLKKTEVLFGVDPKGSGGGGDEYTRHFFPYAQTFRAAMEFADAMGEVTPEMRAEWMEPEPEPEPDREAETADVPVEANSGFEPLLIYVCPGCRANVGDRHGDDCPFERCTHCHRRRVDCRHAEQHDPVKAAWQGKLEFVQ